MKLKYRIAKFFQSESSKLQCHSILNRWLSYYRYLSLKNQELFVTRTLLFLKSTNFKTDRRFRVTEEMRIVISGAFVQITFGLNVDSLDYFRRIFVAPQAYSYKNSDKLFHGDVNPITRTINLSWPQVEKGFIVDDDGLNLCLHEFAHLIVLENAQKSSFMKFFDYKSFEHWKNIGKEVHEKIKAGKSTSLRNYAKTNLMELLAVSTEVFFEKPEYLQNHEPELYKSLTLLFNQDPMNKQNPIL